MSIPELNANTKAANKPADNQLALALDFEEPLAELALLVIKTLSP
jgi:hypothetical protein